MYIDVNIPSGCERIEFFDQDPDEVAMKFAALHGLSENNMAKLSILIEQQLAIVLDELERI